MPYSTVCIVDSVKVIFESESMNNLPGTCELPSQEQSLRTNVVVVVVVKMAPYQVV